MSLGRIRIQPDAGFHLCARFAPVVSPFEGFAELASSDGLAGSDTNGELEPAKNLRLARCVPALARDPKQYAAAKNIGAPTLWLLVCKLAHLRDGGRVRVGGVLQGDLTEVAGSGLVIGVQLRGFQQRADCVGRAIHKVVRETQKNLHADGLRK